MKKLLIPLTFLLTALILTIQPATASEGRTVFLALPTSGGQPVDTVDANPGDGNCADANGFCSLRAAIMEANELSGEDRIVLAGNAPFEIEFPRNEFVVTDDLIIDGNTTSFSIIDGQQHSRLFRVSADLRIEDTTLRNGYANLGDEGGEGGGIYVPSFSDLELVDVIVRNNVGDGFGGGLAMIGGTLLVERSLIEDNVGFDGGGGMWVNANDIVIDESTFGDNTTGGDGGGATLGAPTIRIEDSTFHGNGAGVNGGGLRIGGLASAEFRLIQNTFSNNTSKIKRATLSWCS